MVIERKNIYLFLAAGYVQETYNDYHVNAVIAPSTFISLLFLRERERERERERCTTNEKIFTLCTHYIHLAQGKN